MKAMRVDETQRPLDESPPEQDAPNDGGLAVPLPDTAQTFFPDPGLVAIALEAGRIGIWSWDKASGQITWSRNIEDVQGRSAGSLGDTMDMVETHIHPEDRAGLASAMQEAVRSGSPRRALYRLTPQAGVDERWIETVATVLPSAEGPVRLLGVCRDVSDRVKIHRELRMRAKQQEAIARLGERGLTENDLQVYFDEAVASIAEFLDAEMVKVLELLPGDAELVLRSGIGFPPGIVGVAHVSTDRGTQAGFTLASGGPVIVENLAIESRFSGAPLLRENGVVSGITVPIAGRDGRAYGVLGAHSRHHRKFSEYDVAFVAGVANLIAGAIQRLQLDRRQELMIRELRHQSGNLFSQLLALFSQTAKNSKNIAELTAKYEARVLALANAHRLITEGGWKAAPLQEVLNTLLAPYVDRISFAGPNVLLEPEPTFGLSMAVHELATNAGQHGSLSSRPGRVDVTWQVNRTAQGLTLLFEWKEREGPAPKRMRRPGFGSKLIAMMIERQLNGEVQQTFAPEGLNAKLVVPLTQERWPGGPRPSDAPAPAAA
jgi:two-component sensor histidine kinase